MYSPSQPGISNAFKDGILYYEAPSLEYPKQVYCYWELKTKQSLESDFIYEVLPDGCIDIVFKSGMADSGIVMTPANKTEHINLGMSFHYVGIRLNIGYWKYASDVIDKQIKLDKFTALENATIPFSLQNSEATSQLDLVVGSLIAAGCVNENPISALLLDRAEELHSVEDMTRISGYSRRQLQRILKDETGFLPKQLLAIIRFQSVLDQQSGDWRYSDQAHINRDFKTRTGSTPKKFKEKFSRSMSEIFNIRNK